MLLQGHRTEERTVFTYQAYGLAIASSLTLPELCLGVARHDVVVRCVPVAQDLGGDSGAIRQAGPEHETVLHWEGVGIFGVRGGREVRISPDPQVEAPLLRSFLLGPVFAVLLRQRGFLVLHASAVEIDGRAYLFMGGSGWGKSTVAAALCRQGGRLLSDDVTAIDLTGAEPTVMPGYPQLKLWPDSVAALGLDPEDLPRLHALSDKRVYRDPSQFCDRPVPLGGVCVLAEGTESQIDPLDPQSAIVELVRHSARIRELHATQAPAHLRQCATLVNEARVCRLTVPRSYTLLSEVMTTLMNSVLQPLG